ncbi:hypothetical protein QVD17_07166 [Tagetes erecta]|uniref:RNA-directed DNA polymerase, eukaryota, reverse transcriptase zinc-binding domain protein n=1 Tax=Tagetes erecta TaxID=13708 RepID=A0AAD8PCG5_TARER|nr:hypothetical protein QVD17_07166 [Tagetes erecta]
MLHKQGDLHSKVDKLRKDLEEVQNQVDTFPFDTLLKEREAICLKDFIEASADEELFIKQKAKVNWLDKGDANTKYFHNILKYKNNKRMISSIVRHDGLVLEGDDMINEFVCFYENFLGGEHNLPDCPDSSYFERRGDTNSAACIMEVLRKFADLSGLSPNMHKREE